MTLKEIRNKQGLRATYVANKIGYTREHYSRLENNKVKLTKKHIDKLFKVLGDEVYCIKVGE